MSNTYAKIDTRTSSDPNASADINQLQSNFNSFLDSAGNFTKGGGTNHITFSLAGNAYVDTSIQKLTFATAMSFSKWVIKADIAPSNTLAVDINKNGVSTGIALQLLAGNTYATATQAVAFAKGNDCDWDIDSIGTNTAGGSYLMVSGV
jgi:hypothetical protein